ncbi:hypothetical protein [Chitinophaga filiformis]|uniref:Uncharacterized protein n=1 Tax=Chitinophaga filiformis TaxID=104663 RepID=A0A1G7HNM7_CHIFI|nr:hypothetical protein [Chitinophaga filiformis]SDF01609.1 hypothetical protein SAMN04488121_101530 [Chitinophaga filiformis]
MKMKLNPGSKRNKRTQHGASNTLLIIMLLLIPFLHKPVPSLQGTIRIIFEKQRSAGVDTPPLTINVAVKDELIPVGSATLLLLLFFYVRRKEGAEGVNDEAMPGMEMDDEEVKAAWNKVKRLLSDEDNEGEN